jgi:hypothetical protein
VRDKLSADLQSTAAQIGAVDGRLQQMQLNQQQLAEKVRGQRGHCCAAVIARSTLIPRSRVSLFEFLPPYVSDAMLLCAGGRERAHAGHVAEADSCR